MVITRKIQVYVNESDAELKKNFIHTIYEWRDNIRRAANAIVAHKYVQQNVRDFIYFTEEVEGKFFVKDLLKNERGNSEQNTTYRVASAMLKGKVPSEFFSCLNQAVANTFKETLPDIIKGKASVRSYRNNIPMPFAGKTIKGSLAYNEETKRYTFSLFGIPMACRLGADRSNNAVILDRIISGEWKASGSSLMIDDSRNKMFILLTFDHPVEEHKKIKDKNLYAVLGVYNPIVCYADINAKQEFDSGRRIVEEIGTKEEFNYRRRQMQESIHRLQKSLAYTTGGHGRKQKLKKLEDMKKLELNYVETQAHRYSRMLVDSAIRNRCENIVLVSQVEREKIAEGDEQILRNWSYSGLKAKIEYKAKMNGIKVIVK